MSRFIPGPLNLLLTLALLTLLLLSLSIGSAPRASATCWKKPARTWPTCGCSSR